MSESIKHILIISSWYPTPDKPFLGNFVQEQARLLSSRYKVTVIHTITGENNREIYIKETNQGNLRELLIYYPRGKNFISKRKEQDKAYDKGFELLDKVDLIHGHIVYPSGYYFVKAKKRFSCPLIVTEHSSFYRKEIRSKWNFKERFIVRYTKKYIDKLISVSEFLKRDLVEIYDERLITVLPNAIDTDLFVPTNNQETGKVELLHVSTLDTKIKNPKGLIEAVFLLKEKGYSDFTFTIISDEPYTEWQKEVFKKGLSDIIKFEGPLQHVELVPYFQKCSAFVLFSVYETFSIVIAEAWACGKPVISTSVGIADHMPSDLGIQISKNDTLGLAIAMEKLINGKQFESSKIREYSLAFSKDKVLNELTVLYSNYNG